MQAKQNNIDRRNFLRTVGAAGLGTVLVGCRQKKQAEPNAVEAQPAQAPAGQPPKTPPKDQLAQMPKRKLGKTGVEVPVLALGTMFNLVDNQIVLRSTLKHGVNYWDTANNYAGGNSELGIGKFFENNPETRKDVFLVTKASSAKTPQEIEQRLQTSLKRMNTDYIDLYYAPHAASEPAELTEDLRKWAEDAKKRKLIRYFGFTTHKNMAGLLAAAAKLDWIDVVMPAYNFRIMQDPEMLAAIDACRKANIGLIAMKTTGKTTLERFRQPIETEADKKMIAHFQQRGFSPEQACIKLALQDERISCAAVQMENLDVLKANVAAVLDKTELTQTDKDVLAEYAGVTCTGYCAGCAHICDAVLPDTPYVSDIMRCLMYHNSYGHRERAADLFAQIPAGARNRLLTADYTAVEARCPQRLPIRELVAEAFAKLT
jgi:hypothetical protein